MPANIQERNIVRRKALRLVSELRMTKTDIEEFIFQGFLPAKMINDIQDLDLAPRGNSMQSLVELLEEHAKSGSVRALAVLLEHTNTLLCDELLSELDLMEGKITMDEATMFEAAAMTHKDFGNSKKLGPVDQKALALLLAGRVLVTSGSCQKQLARLSDENTVEQKRSEYKDEEAQNLVERLRHYVQDQGVPEAIRGASGPPNTDRAIIEVNHLLEDIFSYVRDTLGDIERLKEEKMNMKMILEDVEKRRFEDKDHLDHAIISLIQRKRREMDTLRSKLHIVEDRVSESQSLLTKAKKERPITLAYKTETSEKVKDRFMEAEKKYSELVSREKSLITNLNELKGEIDDMKMKLGFVSKSRTVKSIRRQEQIKRRQISGETLSTSLSELPLYGRNNQMSGMYGASRQHYRSNTGSTASSRGYASDYSDPEDYYNR